MNSQHSAARENHGQRSKLPAHESEAPQQSGELPAPARIMQLQSLIGNRAVRRLLDQGRLHPQTGRLQRAPPADGPVAEAPSAAQPAEINFEEGMYIGDAEFHARALPKNQHYARHPPRPGWPYTPDLKSLWERGDYNEFADQVAALQHFRLKLPQDQVDGILGRVTARGLLSATPPEASASSAPTAPVSAPAPEAAAPEAQAPVAAAPETAVVPEAKAPEKAAAAAQPAGDEAVLKRHPSVVRIVAPAEQAFQEYKQAEAEYNKANTELDRARKAEKDSKRPERQRTLTVMEAKRAAARAAMAAARQKVAGLKASEFAGGEAELQRVRAFINRELNANTIYYAQGFNADILSGNKKAAAARTCNMTVIAMMVEALGKSTRDYQGGDLAAIAAQYGGPLGVNNAQPDDLARLRMPDFLQLAAIDVAGGRAEAAEKITAHKFIIQVAGRFGLHLTQVKGGQVQARPAEAESFLSTKHTSALDTLGALYRPAYHDAKKALQSDGAYKQLKGKEREAYERKFIQDFTEQQRQAYLDNVTQWMAIDAFVQEKLTTLRAELSPADSASLKTSAEAQAALEAAISTLKEYGASIPAKYKAKSKEFQKTIAALEKAREKGRSKPDAPAKDLKKLLDNTLKGLADNRGKYAAQKTIYEKLAAPEGIEELVPVDDYRASVIPTMQAAIDSGNQVMVNLDNHFVRLQSVDEAGIVIDDPGTRWGENTRITWEHARQFGYFQHYLMLSP
jgi:hypothetical protein